MNVYTYQRQLLLENIFSINLSFQVLLGSELIKSSSEERSLLKNLGSWLGKITIGRNQVLRAREIDPKSLIIEVIIFLFCRSIGVFFLKLKFALLFALPFIPGY